MKPLFLSLMKQHYLAFADGSKAVEYRKAGSRWNRTTCVVGREIIISNGYTSKGRLRGVITGFKESTAAGMRRGFVEIYGDGNIAACISIKVIGAVCPSRMNQTKKTEG